MSEVLSIQPGMATHAVHHDDHGHHHQSFVSKYIFSMDHKTIAKQFLITGIIWAIIGGLFSVLFRLQLGYPDQSFPILETFFGKWAKGGQIQPEFYYSLITMHGTVLVFFVLTAGLSGTFANFFDSPPDRGQGYGFSFPEHAFLLVLLYGQYRNGFLLIHLYRPCIRRMDHLPTVKCTGPGITGFKTWYGHVAHQYGTFHHLLFTRGFKLYLNDIKSSYKRNEHDKAATNDLGFVLYRCTGSSFVPRIAFRSNPFVIRQKPRYQLLPE